MFNNLIESSSHAREYKRRGSFLLFTTATYLVLFAIAGVASIYAYDAHLEAQSTELQLLTFVPVPPAEVPLVVRNTIRPASDSDNPPTRSTRTELIDSASNPNNVPDKIGTIAPNVPPARIDSVIDKFNADPPGPAFAGNRGVPGGSGNTPVVNIPDIPPPAPDPPRAANKILKISVVLNSKALELPAPTYPALATQIRLQGTVTVQVLIDESGRVVSAKALTGHTIFVKEAERAAMRARFSPTTISDQPVKVQGVITYNFVMK
jgi:periplasmic protein TonB